MTKSKILALLAVMVLLIALPAVALAQVQPPRPAVFGGTVTLDGATAADGTIVTASIGGNEVASTTVVGGAYALTIAQPPGEDFAGKPVVFTIGGFRVIPTATWQDSGGGELNLSASSALIAAVGTKVAGVTRILCTSKLRTLYLFTKDTHGKPGTAAKSACTSAGCMAKWPPLTTEDPPRAITGADQTFLGTAEHPSGVTQVTYHGWPLYTYAPDTAPGDVKGQGVAGVWWVLGADGMGITGAGTPGEAGPAGKAGKAGTAGPGGVAGPGGAKGDAGAAGAAGAAGKEGAGKDGAAGRAGSAGVKGDQGNIGSAGATGATGAAGAAGPPGASGGGGALGIITLIIAIVAVIGAGGAIVMGRRT